MSCCGPIDSSNAGLTPTLEGFTTFVYNQMAIPVSALPTDSPYIPMAYNIALDIVTKSLAQVSCDIYTLAIYNLGGSNILNFAPDQVGALPVEGSDPPLPYFAHLRSSQGYNMISFVAGVVSSTGDQGTAVGLLNPDFMKNLTLADLQYLKDPFGRQYLAFAQRYGPTIWGLT